MAIGSDSLPAEKDLVDAVEVFAKCIQTVDGVPLTSDLCGIDSRILLNDFALLQSCLQDANASERKLQVVLGQPPSFPYAFLNCNKKVLYALQFRYRSERWVVTEVGRVVS